MKIFHFICSRDEAMKDNAYTFFFAAVAFSYMIRDCDGARSLLLAHALPSVATLLKYVHMQFVQAERGSGAAKSSDIIIHNRRLVSLLRLLITFCYDFNDAGFVLLRSKGEAEAEAVDVIVGSLVDIMMGFNSNKGSSSGSGGGGGGGNKESNGFGGGGGRGGGGGGSAAAKDKNEKNVFNAVPTKSQKEHWYAKKIEKRKDE